MWASTLSFSSVACCNARCILKNKQAMVKLLNIKSDKSSRIYSDRIASSSCLKLAFRLSIRSWSWEISIDFNSKSVIASSLSVMQKNKYKFYFIKKINKYRKKVQVPFSICCFSSSRSLASSILTLRSAIVWLSRAISMSLSITMGSFSLFSSLLLPAALKTNNKTDQFSSLKIRNCLEFYTLLVCFY